MNTSDRIEDPARYDGVEEDWHLREQARRFRRIVEVLVQERAAAPLLEMGALGGGFALQYASALGLAARDVVCCDFSAAQLRRADERGFTTCRWNLASEPVPPELRRGSFKTILLCEVIEHLVDPGEVVGVLVSLLAPGGLLLCTTPNLASLNNRVRLLLGQSPSLGAAPGLHVRAAGSLTVYDHLRVCVPGEWVALFESAGLRVTRVEGCTSGPVRGGTLRRRLALSLHSMLERAPGALWMNTLLVARKPSPEPR